MVSDTLCLHSGVFIWGFVYALVEKRLMFLNHTTPFPDIVRDVCEKYMVTWNQLRGECRMHYLVLARQELFYRASKETKLSLQKISDLCHRDHSTVSYGIKKHMERTAA